jgi:hypothetical protein
MDGDLRKSVVLILFLNKKRFYYSCVLFLLFCCSGSLAAGQSEFLAAASLGPRCPSS